MTISERIERLPESRFLVRILLILGAGWAFDAMMTGMAGGISAALKTSWGLDKGALGVYSSIAMVGMAVGAALSGRMSDRMGRKSVVILNLFLFSMGSIIGGFSVNYAMLLVTRFITGIGIGGYLPQASSMLSEFTPTKIRGKYGVLLESFWAWGWIFSALVAYLIIPKYGFQGAQFTGIIPLLLCVLFYYLLPESPRYLALNGRTKEADAIVDKMEEACGIHDHVETVPLKPMGKVKLSELFTKEHKRATIVLWILWFGINFGYYGFVLWTPSLLIEKGFDMVKSFEMTLIMSLAQLPGYYSAAFLVERIGRKKLVSIYLFLTAVASWFYGNANSVTEIYIYGSFLYFSALGAWGCVYAFTPESYPTALRGTGTGFASAFGRVGAFIAPYVVPIVYNAFGKEQGFISVFIVMSLVFLLTAVIVMIFAEETMGRELDR
ncbi:MFS transporter [Guggenheimella bovis]